MYSEKSIADVRDVDIQAVVSHFVTLDRNLKAKCPIHGEKTPSFSIHKAKNFYKCFGCGAGGDGINFVMRLKNCDFITAVETVAGIGGVHLEVDEGFDKDAFEKMKLEKMTSLEIMRTAVGIYRSQLLEKKNKKALEYWKSRGYGLDVIMDWELGYAPRDFHLLTEIFRESNDIAGALKVGVLNEKDDRVFDVYIDRVTIPIHNEFGEIVGISGRVLDKDSKYPKYINSKASSLFNKSNILFGLHQAAPSIKNLGFAFLVEGYTDVISMHQAGADNTIAKSGTEFTDGAIAVLKKHTKHVVLISDDDDAGRKAIEKDMAALLKAGMKADVFILEGGMDPDDFARNYKPEIED